MLTKKMKGTNEACIWLAQFFMDNKEAPYTWADPVKLKEFLEKRQLNNRKGQDFCNFANFPPLARPLDKVEENYLERLGRETPTEPVLEQIGGWVVFEVKIGESLGESVEGFFISKRRMLSFKREVGWAKNHIIPCYIKASEKGGT